MTAKLNKITLEKDKKIDFSVNTKHSVEISIVNSSNKMAKDVELGFIFPKEVLIEETENLDLYTNEKQQIVRFNENRIQAHENFIKGDLNITFLATGEMKVGVFIKGENVPHSEFQIKMNIVK